MMRVLAKILQWLSMLFSRAAHTLERTLPALIPVKEIIELVREHYTVRYREDLCESDASLEPLELEVWERLVLDRYKIDSGRMLLLGAGWGREAIAIARRGVRVVGVDTNRDAVRKASQLARREQVTATFQQGDFLALSHVPASFDYVLLGSNMYSAIPGIAHRHAWLADSLSLLRPDGKVILSFLPRYRPLSRLRSLFNRLNRVLMWLPEANHEYQVGDICYEFHYLHEFQDQDELRGEFAHGGATILELNWDLGYAVVGK